jgi:hypothetical protein
VSSNIKRRRGSVKPETQAANLKVHTPPPEVPRNLPRYLTSADLAKLLGIHTRTLKRWRAAGLVPPPVRAYGWLKWPRDTITRWFILGQPDLKE